MPQIQIDFPEEKKAQRDRLFKMLSDLQWHSWREMEACTNGPRYGARWLELKLAGYECETEPLDDGSTGLRYRLRSLVKGKPRKPQMRVYLDPAAVALFLESGSTVQIVPAIAEAYAKHTKNKKKNTGGN